MDGADSIGTWRASSSAAQLGATERRCEVNAKELRRAAETVVSQYKSDTTSIRPAVAIEIANHILSTVREDDDEVGFRGRHGLRDGGEEEKNHQPHDSAVSLFFFPLFPFFVPLGEAVDCVGS